jgi:hypothetical protein
MSASAPLLVCYDGSPGAVEANERQRRAAAETGHDGARREAIEEVAIERDVLLIVCGTSRSGLKSALPGNLAGVLAQRSSRPVLVVPSARATAERRQAFEKEHRRATFASATRR